MKEKLKQTKPRIKSFINEIWPVLAFIFLAAVVGLLFSPSKTLPLGAPFSKRLLIRLAQPVNIIIGISWFTFLILSLVNATRFLIARLKRDSLLAQLVYKRSLKTCVVGFFAVLVMWIFVNIDLLLPKKEVYRFPEGAVYEAEGN